MKCMVCGEKTPIKFRLNEIEAAFCHRHIPQEREAISRMICCYVQLH